MVWYDRETGVGTSVETFPGLPVLGSRCHGKPGPARAPYARRDAVNQTAIHPSLSCTRIFIFGCRRHVMFVLPFSIRIHFPGKYSLIMRVSTHAIWNGIRVSESTGYRETHNVYCSFIQIQLCK